MFILPLKVTDHFQLSHVILELLMQTYQSSVYTYHLVELKEIHFQFPYYPH